MSKNTFLSMMYGFITILVIVLVTSVVISLLLKFTSLTESSFSVITMVVSFFALFVGGMISGKKGQEKGLMIGAGTGILYALLIFFIQFLGFESGFSVKQAFIFSIYVVMAAFGGIVGVNTKQRQKS